MGRYKSVITILFIFWVNISSSQDLKYDNHGFETLDGLAQSYLNILNESYVVDSEVLKHFADKEHLVYIVNGLAKIDSLASVNKDEALTNIDNNYKEMATQPLFVTKNIRCLIHQDSVDLKNTKIESISSEIIDSFNFNPTFVIVKMKLSLKYKGKIYNLIIENAGHIMNKWYILGMSISWNGKYAMYDRQQVEFENGHLK